MSKGMIILRGLPASGKSTWAREQVAVNPDGYVRVNRDDLRIALYGKQYGAGIDEPVVTAAQDAAIRAILEQDKTAIVDNMNVRPQYVKGLYKIAQEFDIEPIIAEFHVDLETAIERDAKRVVKGEHVVGEKALRSLYRRYVDGKGNYPQLPAFEPEPTFQPYEPDVSLPTAYGFDLDGSLARMTGRSPYDPSRYHEDTSDAALKTTAAGLKAAGHAIIVLTGRNEDYREACEQWLHAHGIEYDELIMRPSDQPYRKDSHVKSELFDKYVAPRYNFLAQFDDRNQVVNALRSKGINVYQVEPGNF